ncbi:hypothetical protein [Methanosarcina barkeri]|uniref:hypothetical protein n=1 Tax=Methanosarcina barkeri TaxID=2208 RepID=UPI001FB4AAA3|nr:hypothetical protein [Methanosarcina barkeri]
MKKALSLQGQDLDETIIGLLCLPNFRFLTYFFSGPQPIILKFFFLLGLLLGLLLNLSLNLMPVLLLNLLQGGLQKPLP